MKKKGLRATSTPKSVLLHKHRTGNQNSKPSDQKSLCSRFDQKNMHKKKWPRLFESDRLDRWWASSCGKALSNWELLLRFLSRSNQMAKSSIREAKRKDLLRKRERWRWRRKPHETKMALKARNLQMKGKGSNVAEKVVPLNKTCSGGFMCSPL